MMQHFCHLIILATLALHGGDGTTITTIIFGNNSLELAESQSFFFRVLLIDSRYEIIKVAIIYTLVKELN